MVPEPAAAPTETAEDFRTITPHLNPKVLRKLNALIEVRQRDGVVQIAAALRRLQDLWQDEPWSLELRAVGLLLADLIDQGWDVRAGDNDIHLRPPGLRVIGETPEQAKIRLRRALEAGRDRQIGDASVQKFLGRMHRVVLRSAGRSSIADVIDDGAELSRLLHPFAGVPAAEAAVRLKGVIDPVIEVCDEEAKCPVTGLALLDIWRYFRHTWSLEYRSLPGRQLAFLVRNAARPKRPVIGIAMLASPVVRMRVRDDWIGWNPEPFIETLRTGAVDAEVALRALISRLERSISEIRSDDLVNPDELAFPSERTILKLEQKGAGAAAIRRRELEQHYSEAEEASVPVRSQKGIRDFENADWLVASTDPLFVRKRADTLGRLLDAKRTFQALDWKSPGARLLENLLQHPNGLRTMNVALQEVRKAGLSSQVADVSVCGAVAPYNLLLGGKLVALLMASKEARDAYRTRYGAQVSMISSQMAGRPIFKPAELKILTTTSLYGNGSSQYNRLRLPRSQFPQLEFDLQWQELAKTAGYGTVHLGSTTVKVLREVSERTHRARRVNNRFGEGASPRLRQIRDALDALGIDSTYILHHATPRIFYGCELHPGARQELLGLVPTTSTDAPVASVVASAWRERWLSSRIKNGEVMDRLQTANAEAIQSFFQVVSGAETTEPVADLFSEVASGN